MAPKKYTKVVAIGLSLFMMANFSPQVYASDLVAIPQNNSSVIIPKNSSIIQSNSTDFSMKSIESRINNIIDSKQNKKLQEVYSGNCGENVFWNLNTDTGLLTIYGSGDMHNFNGIYYSILNYFTDAPWYIYKDLIKSVEIRNGVTSIGNWALGIYYDYYNQDNRYRLKSVIIPNSVTKINYRAFEYTDLPTLNIPNNVVSIGDRAFYKGTLTQLTIPDSVTEIGKESFYNCNNLSSVSLGLGVTSIGENAFSQCGSLTSVTLSNDYAVANFRTIFPNYANITTVNLGEGVTTIPDNTFMGCEKLKSITIPSSVKSIGKYAFSFCSSLTDFKYLGNSSPTVVENAFDDCPNLKAIKVTNNYLDNECCGLPIIRFGYCGNDLHWELQPSTGALDIDGSGQMINYTANSPVPWDAYKSDIKSVDIGEGVKSIGDNAFISCNNLTSVTLPSSITSIGSFAFSGCENLTTLSLDNGITNMGTNAFASCKNLSSVNFYGLAEPTNDKTAFSQCDMLTEVNVPTTYDNDTFCGLPVAKTIIVPNENTDTIVPNENPDTSETNPEETDDTKGSKLSTGGIVGTIFGAIVALATASGITITCCKKNNCCNDVDISCSC